METFDILKLADRIESQVSPSTVKSTLTTCLPSGKSNSLSFAEFPALTFFCSGSRINALRELPSPVLADKCNVPCLICKRQRLAVAFGISVSSTLVDSAAFVAGSAVELVADGISEGLSPADFAESSSGCAL